MKITYSLFVAARLEVPAIGQAQSRTEDRIPIEAAPSPAITVSGSATIMSDYRSRISNREAGHLRPRFGKGQDGTGHIAGSIVLASLTAAF